MKFPKPNYTVEYKEVRRGAITWHEYPVVMPDGTKVGPFHSATKISGIVNKPLLIPWAKKLTIQCAREELLKAYQSGKVIDLATIDGIMEMAKKAADAYKDKAADIGTRTHEAIDRWILGMDPKLEPDTKPGFDNFMRFLESEKLRVVMGDTNIASLKYKVGGRSDVYFEKNGKLILGDFKTGKALYDEATIQVGCYDVCTEETYGLKVDATVVLRLGKEVAGDFEPKWVNLAEARDSFHYACGLVKQLAKKGDLWTPAPVLA